jgi:stage V sporulation protein D (sporulation-specific penicillin-binding protein)
MSDSPTAKMKRRTNRVVLLGLFALAFAIIMQLFDTAITNNVKYQNLANRYHFGSITISANRGTIYDSNNKVLAQSATVFKVFIDPSLFRDEMERVQGREESKKAKALKEGIEYEMRSAEQVKAEIVDFLAKKLEIDESKIYDAIEANTQYRVLKTQVEKKIADEITQYMIDNGINSIKIEEDTKRYYPKNELAATVIGFTNADGVGQYGVEAYYDEYLAGVDGKVISAMDANGDEMPYKYSKTFDAQPGNSVYLTIDSTLQYYLEKNLNEMVITHQVEERACGIIMNAKTGAILAMANWPSFNLNEPYEITDQKVVEELKKLEGDAYHESRMTELYSQWKNKAINEIYIPGSVFKVVTSAAALEEKVISLESSFDCSGAYVVVPGTAPIHCWKTSGHGIQNFNDALKNSCNPAFMQIGAFLGANKFFEYFEAFGLTQKTGIDLPGEASSFYQGLDGMGPVELASSSFGQTNKITPIEMLNAYAAVINGGYLLTPYVVDKVVDNDGNVILKNQTVIKRQVVSNQTSEMMRESLEYVVNNNGGSNAYIKGYHIGGKSGTSEKLDMYDKDNMRYISSYVCFAPANDPEIIMLIMADEPMGGEYYGSVVAVPYARKILEEALPYLGYYPEYTEEELATLDVTTPLLVNKAVIDAQATLADLGLEAEIVGNGERVVAQVPIKNSKIPRGARVILYTEENYEEEMVTVPDVIGMNLARANETLSSKGLNYVLAGASTQRETAVVQSQSYPPGTKVSKGTIVELTFVIHDQSG